MSQTIPTALVEGLTLSDKNKILDCLQRHASIDPDEVVQNIKPLTPDASTRKYFRVPFTNHQSAIIALYAEAFDKNTLPFLDVTRLFETRGLPVPKILAVDAENGIVVQEDLGDKQLIAVMETADEIDRDAFIEAAIDLIARIQAATQTAFKTNSVAARQAFDAAKLGWEINYFTQHFFGSYRHKPLSVTSELDAELKEIVNELARRPRVLCHRDFHGANIIVDKENRLRVIDYQDARMGAASYDLVSLLLDRRLALPSLAEIRERRLFLLERRRAHGLEMLDPDEFAAEFRLTAIQRGLKAIGTFSYQTAINKRGEVYEKYINPQLRIVLQAAQWLNRFPHLQQMLESEIAGSADS